MSEYYNPKRTRNIFNPKSKDPFAISRSKIDLFFECPKCFYLDRRLGVGRPPGFPFNLNSAVDKLLKKEFDRYRALAEPHPLMKKYGLSATPFAHKNLDDWRENFVGVRHLHGTTNLLITGAVDDVWQNEQKELHVVDYKSTSKDAQINLDAQWQDGYKRQMEVYQWLLRQNQHPVSDIGYFVYCNGKTDREAFDAKLEFEITIIEYRGKDGWVEEILPKIKSTLMSESIPEAQKDCDYCRYREATDEAIKGVTLGRQSLF